VIARAYPWNYAWDEETAALCDWEVTARLAREGIALTGVRALRD
jgi:hypothetical protein